MNLRDRYVQHTTDVACLPTASASTALGSFGDDGGLILMHCVEVVYISRTGLIATNAILAMWTTTITLDMRSGQDTVDFARVGTTVHTLTRRLRLAMLCQHTCLPGENRTYHVRQPVLGPS